jgi:chitinase
LLTDAMMMEVTWDDQWIGYDNDETIAQKKSWADNQCFGGTMAWSVDFDSGAGKSVPFLHHSYVELTLVVG